MLIEAAQLDLQSMKIGFIGAGDSSQALAKSLLQRGSKQTIDGCNLYVTETIKERVSMFHFICREFWQKLGATWAENHQDLVVKSDIIVLAVHPQDFMEVISEVMHKKEGQNIEQTKKLFISFIRGMKLEYLIEHLQSITSKLTVARAVTNSLVVKGAGFTVFSMGPYNAERIPDNVMVEAFFSHGGDIKEVPESEIDTYAALIESAPSIMLKIIKAIYYGGISIGVLPPFATELAAQMIRGAARKVMAGLISDESPLCAFSNETEIQYVTVLKKAVCPPGGATAAFLDVLEKDLVGTAFANAIEAAAVQAKKMERLRLTE